MKRRERWELFLALLISMALFALLRFRLEGEADLGWHLAQGRLLAGGHWLTTNALAWTTPDEPWVDTSWLFDLLTFQSTKCCPELLGPKLVIAVFFALTLFFLGLAALELAPFGIWLLPAIALLLAPRATPRPHVTSWATLACVLWLCLRAHRLDATNSLVCKSSAQRLRLVALLPLWLGAQLHAGAAFAAAPLGLFSLEALLRTRAPRALLPALLAPLALIAGPAGPASIVHLLRHWNLSEVVSILEFQAWTLRSEPYLPLLALAALFAIFSRNRETGPATLVGKTRFTWPPAQLALAACAVLFACLTLRAVRIFYECVVVLAPALAMLFEQLRLRQGRRVTALALVFTTAVCALPHGIPDQLGSLQFAPRWDEHEFPVRAARFLNAHSIDGRGFNGLRDGGYLAWARPAVPIFIDARIHAYPAAFWHEFEAAEANGATFDRFLREEGAAWALTEREAEAISGHHLLERAPGWALVYWDDTSALYLRRDQPRFASQIESLEYKLIRPEANALAEIEQAGPTQLAGIDAELSRFLEGNPGDAWALSMACASRTRQGALDAASRCKLAEQAASKPGDERLLELVQSLETK